MKRLIFGFDFLILRLPAKLFISDIVDPRIWRSLREISLLLADNGKSWKLDRFGQILGKSLLVGRLQIRNRHHCLAFVTLNDQGRGAPAGNLNIVKGMA